MISIVIGVRSVAGWLVELLGRFVAFECDLSDVTLDDQELAEQLHVQTE